MNGQIDATLAELLPGVQQRLGVEPDDDVDLADLVNARITGLSVVVTPAAVATVVPLSAASAATTRAGRRAVTDIVTGADDRLAVIAGPCSIHDPAAALEYAGFIARMRERHGDDLEIVMRTYTEKPRTEVDWKGFAYDPFLDGSSRISVGLVATRMLMCRITALGVPVAAEPLNALTPQYVNGLVTYNGVGARNVTDQTARERVSGFSSVVGFKNSPEGSIDAADPGGLDGARAARVPRRRPARGERSAVDDGQRDRPRHPARRQGTARTTPRPTSPRPSGSSPERGLPEVVVVDASHGNSQKNHLRQIDVVRDLAGQIAARRAGDPRGDGREQPRRRTAGPRPPPSRVAGVRQERHRRLRRPPDDRVDAGRAGRGDPGPARQSGRRSCGGGRRGSHLAGPGLRRGRDAGMAPASWSNGSGPAGSGGMRWRAASGSRTSARATS